MSFPQTHSSSGVFVSKLARGGRCDRLPCEIVDDMNVVRAIVERGLDNLRELVRVALQSGLDNL